jgi:hypothetical protein
LIIGNQFLGETEGDDDQVSAAAKVVQDAVNRVEALFGNDNPDDVFEIGDEDE